MSTKIPIEGKFENPETGLWTAINYVLRNAFVYALKPSIDNDVNIGKVEEVDTKKTFLQKIFGSDKEDDKKDDSKKGSSKKDKSDTRKLTKIRKMIKNEPVTKKREQRIGNYYLKASKNTET
jgi:hypothetical protein